MPNLDKTGPEGKGKQTGRGKGSCGDKTREELSKALDFPKELGLGLGLGRKNRRGEGPGQGQGRRSTDKN
jgi:hypothetical protein